MPYHPHLLPCLNVTESATMYIVQRVVVELYTTLNYNATKSNNYLYLSLVLDMYNLKI